MSRGLAVLAAVVLALSGSAAAQDRAVLARLDRRRAKQASNEEWKSPSDPDAKITKMKDGRTHLAHKPEHAVDIESGAIVALTVQDASIGDTGTIMDTLAEAEGQLVTLQFSARRRSRRWSTACRTSSRTRAITPTTW